MTVPVPPEVLYSEYSANEKAFVDAARGFEKKVAAIAASAGIVPTLVKARAKRPLELYKKQRIKNYPDPWVDCPDLVGARVIVATMLDKQKMLESLKAEVDLDVFDVEDQTLTLDPAELAYAGLHVHARCNGISNHRNDLVRCEIQIRTTAEHAWAETQHRYIYKKDIEVPAAVSRLFNRLIALVEIFDSQMAEGVSFMEQLPEYRVFSVTHKLEELHVQFSHAPSNLIITFDSLSELTSAGMGTPDELLEIAESYVEHNRPSINELMRKYGPSSAQFDVASHWILTQAECLVFLALLESRPSALARGLAGSDLSSAVERIALMTGNAAFA